MKININFNRYGLYLLRWQLSTPILAVVLLWLSSLNKWTATIIANFVGGLIFFWIDKFIFVSRHLSVQWEVRENISCVDCGRIARGYRIARTKNYDKSNAKPEFRCETCSALKTVQLRKLGVEI